MAARTGPRPRGHNPVRGWRSDEGLPRRIAGSGTGLGSARKLRRGVGGVKPTPRHATSAPVRSGVPGAGGKEGSDVHYTGRVLESLRGREIWIYGERVKDVTAHPAFRNPARMVARLYDALHDPATRPVLTCPTDTGSGGYHPSLLPGPHQRRRPGRGPRRDRRLGAADLRMDGPLAGLQGGLPGHARRQRRLLRPVPGQRPALVPRRPRSASST